MTPEQYETIREQTDALLEVLPKLGGELRHEAKVLVEAAQVKLLMYEVANGIRR